MQNGEYQDSERRNERRLSLTHGYTTIYVGRDQTPIEAVVSNISENGACVYTSRSIENESPVSVFNRAFGAFPRRATVVWSREIADGLYASGLTLSQHNDLGPLRVFRTRQ